MCEIILHSSSRVVQKGTHYEPTATIRPTIAKSKTHANSHSQKPKDLNLLIIFEFLFFSKPKTENLQVQVILNQEGVENMTESKKTRAKFEKAVNIRRLA